MITILTVLCSIGFLVSIGLIIHLVTLYNKVRGIDVVADHNIKMHLWISTVQALMLALLTCVFIVIK